MSTVARRTGHEAMLIAGLCVGVLGAVLSLRSPGSGHGWYAGLIGVVSVVFAPLAAQGWHVRRTRGNSTLSRFVLAGGILADLAVFGATEFEGGSYMAGSAGVAALWWLIFLSWQVLSWVTLAFIEPASAA
jgi:uncharacterized membrane protein